MVCFNCGKHPGDFRDELQYSRHLKHCGSGITYDLKIMNRLRNTDKEKGSGEKSQ